MTLGPIFETTLIKGSRYAHRLSVEDESIAFVVSSYDKNLMLINWSHRCFYSRRELLLIRYSEQLPMRRLMTSCKRIHVDPLEAVHVRGYITASEDVDEIF